MPTYDFRSDADSMTANGLDLDLACYHYARTDDDLRNVTDADSLIRAVERIDGAWLRVTDETGRVLICVGDLPESSWQRVVP